MMRNHLIGMVVGMAIALPQVAGAACYFDGQQTICDQESMADLSEDGPTIEDGFTAFGMAYGLPAPMARGYGEYMSSTIVPAAREANPIDGMVRQQYGVSMRDIRDHGPLGGKKSEARKILGVFGIH